MKKRIAGLLVALLLLSACSGGAPSKAASSESTPVESLAAQPPVDYSWKTDLPENHGMNPEVLAELHSALEKSQVYSMVTAKDGVIIDEYYGEGYDETSVFNLHSCSKSFTGALIGIAIDEGYIGGVDDLLSAYLPQVLELGEEKQTLTLRHLLTHTAGLSWYEWGGGYSNWQEFQSAPNWVEYILGRDLVAPPGTVFNYSTGNTHLLSAVLEKATGMSALEYGKIKLFTPLGMESVAWRTDPQGVTDGGNGIAMTARDALRFGQLYLNGGIQNGVQLISLDWLAASTTLQNAGPGGSTGAYGYQWWMRSFGGYDTYYAFGAWGQYIFIVPQLNLVTVIASHYPENSYAPRAYFTDYILPAYTG